MPKIQKQEVKLKWLPKQLTCTATFFFFLVYYQQFIRHI